MVKRKYKAGETITYKNVGFGLTTYERDTVVSMSQGKLFTNSFSSSGMEWKEAEQTWVYDGGVGMKSSIVPNDDPDALKDLGPVAEQKPAPAAAKKKAAKKKVVPKKPRRKKAIGTRKKG